MVHNLIHIFLGLTELLDLQIMCPYAILCLIFNLVMLLMSQILPKIYYLSVMHITSNSFLEFITVLGELNYASKINSS